MGLFDWLRTLIARLRGRRFATRFGTAYVYERPWGHTRVRVLDVDGSLQSATYVDERWCDVVFPYLALFDCAFEDHSHATSLCMLGGGGCSYAKHVVAHHPQARIDVVEADPAILRIAQEHFLLDRLEREFGAKASGRLRLMCDDGLDYLRACERQGTTYDAIINDCFVAHDADASLATPQAARLLHACLAPGGLYLTNVISALEGEEAEPLFALTQTLAESFAHIGVLPCGRTDEDEADNVVVVATDSPDLPHDALVLYDAT